MPDVVGVGLRNGKGIMTGQAIQSQSIPGSSFARIGKVIFGITFRQAIRSKKTIFMLILTFLPVLLAIAYRVLGRDVSPNQPFSRVIRMDPEQVLTVIMPFFLQFLSVLNALFYGTAIVADEVDNKTIIYLFTRPVRKYWIVLSKFAAYMVEVLLILVPPMVITFLILVAGSGMSSHFAGSLSLFGKQLGTTVLALITYGAVFTFFGIWWKRPVLFGLLFAFGWEKMAIVAPGVVRKFSVIHYLMSLLPQGPAARQFMRSLKATSSDPAFSIFILALITIVFLGLSIFAIHRKEYRFE